MKLTRSLLSRILLIPIVVTIVAGCGSKTETRVQSRPGSGSLDVQATPSYPRGPSSGAWNRFSFDEGNSAILFVEEYSDLSELATRSDAVVAATVVDVKLGRSFGEEKETQVQYGVMSISVVSLLAGNDPDRDGGGLVRLEFPIPVSDPRAAEAFVSGLKELDGDGPNIFFLRSKRSEAQRLGLPADRVTAESGYYRLVHPVGLAVTADGGNAKTLVINLRIQLWRRLPQCPCPNLTNLFARRRMPLEVKQDEGERRFLETLSSSVSSFQMGSKLNEVTGAGPRNS